MPPSVLRCTAKNGKNRFGLTLTNDLNALIFCGGNLAIGGALDTHRQAIGRGGVINNAGGTIQSLGTLSITAQQINNTNPNFNAVATFGPTVYQTTYLTSLGTFTSDQVSWANDNLGWDGTSILAGNGSRHFPANTLLTMVKQGVATPNVTVYSIINESYQPLVAQVLSSTPGQILSGSTMTLDASQALINDKSRIIAGGALNVFGQSIANIAAQVSGIETHTGTSSSWGYAGYDGKSTGHHCDCDFYAFKAAPYALNLLVTVSSPIALVQQYQAPGGGSAVPGQGRASSIGTTTASVPVNLTVPATSLYILHPGPGSGYLIETDPRFANYRSWLSSDYLLTALAYAPNSVQKRLGDGFYEQQLIREQIALLRWTERLCDLRPHLWFAGLFY